MVGQRQARMANTGGNAHGTSSASRGFRHHFLHGMRHSCMDRHGPISAIRSRHLACHPTPVHRVCRNHRGMWSHLVHLGVCAQLHVDDVETWLDHSYSPYLRDTRFVRGLRVDHFRHGVHAAFHCQQHDGVAHVKRLSDCALRRDLGGRRLCHVRTGGTHECQDHRILVAVLRGFRCQHRRIDVR